jgi:hypothetical protein
METGSTSLYVTFPLSSMVEQETFNFGVVGSSPTGGTMLICQYCGDDYSNVPNADSTGSMCNICDSWFCSESCYEEHVKQVDSSVRRFD